MLELFLVMIVMGVVIYHRSRDHHHRLEAAWRREQYARCSRFYR